MDDWQMAVGRIAADGSRQWPAVTIGGLAYTRPAHTLDIDADAFVVLDVFPTPDMAQRLAAVCSWWADQRSARRRRKAEDDQ